MLQRLHALFHRDRFEREMDLELRHHRESYIRDLISRGTPPAEAEQRATREFGPLLQFKDECREARGLYWPDALSRDLRYALRQLAKNPTFALTAVLTLALCIGANTAIFSVVDAVLFRPLPFPEPGRLAAVTALRRGLGAEYEQFSQNGTTWKMLHESVRSLGVAVHSGSSEGINFVAPTGARFVQQHRVCSGFFHVIGVAPLVGREFSESEDRPNGPALVILGNNLWNDAFHADPNIIGQKVTLRGEPYTVIGVMPPGFHTSVQADLWTPLRATTTGEGGNTNFEIIARLRPGVSWAQATAEMAALSPQIVAEWHLKTNQGASLRLIPLQTGLASQLRKPVLILWAAVALVLLIGCVNISGLLLARSGTRAKEIATRLALGSGRGAIVRQFLAESGLLAIGGGLVGILLGYLALQALKAYAQKTLGVWQTLSLDPRVLAGTAVTALLASVIFGLYPALATSRIDLRSALAQSGARGASGSHRGWSRRLLVVAEVALGVVLLVGSGLLIRTLASLTGLNPGFDPNHLVAATLSLQDAHYTTTDAVTRLYNESLNRIQQIPGVESAAICLTLPYQRPLNDGFQRLDGPNAGAGFESSTATYITPDYLDTFRIPLLRGRAFTSADRAGAARVVLVNDTFARKYLAGQEAVGSHIKLDGTPHEIVGVVGDIQVGGAGWGGNIGPVASLPGMYVPVSQLDGKFLEVLHTWFSPSWVVRSSLPLKDLMGPLQSAVSSIDPQLPFSRFRTMDQLRSQAIALPRLETVLLGALSGLALILSALGIYGLIANSVIERTREFGIRMALGSSTSRAVREVALPGILLSSVGLVIGCAIARAASKVMKSLIWGVAPDDPATFLMVAIALLLVALLASLLPGLRVAKINPAETLRAE